MEKTAGCQIPGHREVSHNLSRKIETSKQFITNEAKRTNDTLLAFQHKFEFELKKTKEELQTNINTLAK
jgi:hypothetical protein